MGFQTRLKKTSYQIIFHNFGVSEKDVALFLIAGWKWTVTLYW